MYNLSPSPDHNKEKDKEFISALRSIEGGTDDHSSMNDRDTARRSNGDDA